MEAVPNYSAGRNVVIYNQPRELKIRAAIAYHKGWKALKYTDNSPHEFKGIKPGEAYWNYFFVPHYEKERGSEFIAVVWLAARGMRL